MRPTDPDIESLRVAAETGVRLVESRRAFRACAESAMNAFAAAEAALLAGGDSGWGEAVSATGTAFAQFIAETESAWDEEDDFEGDLPPEPDSTRCVYRNKLEDYRDGRLVVPAQSDFVECALARTAATLTLTDPVAARRVARLALAWGAERNFFEKHPGWARRNGAIPYADTAPLFAALLFAQACKHREIEPDRAHALRMGSLAYRELHDAARAYACVRCAEFAFGDATGRDFECEIRGAD